MCIQMANNYLIFSVFWHLKGENIKLKNHGDFEFSHFCKRGLNMSK
jgi:hypothetical protein